MWFLVMTVSSAHPSVTQEGSSFSSSSSTQDVAQVALGLTM